MQPKDIIKKHLAAGGIMQLATIGQGRPWVCTVHFVADAAQDAPNLYWLSLPSRRHSQEIAKDNHVAVAVAVKTEKPVVGIQGEGQASEVSDPEVIKQVMRAYVERFKIGGQFYDNFVAGKNQHRLYKFTPAAYVLFDEVNFPQDSRREWRLQDVL